MAFPAGVSRISRLAFRAVKDERGTGVGPIDEGVGEQQKPRGSETGRGGFLLVARFSSCARAKHLIDPRPYPSSLAPPRLDETSRIHLVKYPSDLSFRSFISVSRLKLCVEIRIGLAEHSYIHIHHIHMYICIAGFL